MAFVFFIRLKGLAGSIGQDQVYKRAGLVESGLNNGSIVFENLLMQEHITEIKTNLDQSTQEIKNLFRLTRSRR